MANDKIQMPQSGGGLVRYFDEVKSKIEFGPWSIIIIIAIIILLEIILHTTNLFGL